MRRREFITLVGGATAWPFATRAQQPAMRVIGFLHLTSHDETRAYLLDFHQGLAEAGYVEGKNVAIEYRWGEGRNDRMPNLISDLVRRQVSVIVTLESTLTALAGKKATNTIPIIFMQGLISLLPGNLVAETGSQLTASSATRSGLCRLSLGCASRLSIPAG
jgi:putative ABC transport system substrate-binding protein